MTDSGTGRAADRWPLEGEGRGIRLTAKGEAHARNEHRQPEAEGYVGRSVPRRDDRRLVIGAGRYVADLRLPGMLEVAFLRSTHAHAAIVRLEMEPARAAGAELAVGGADVTRSCSALRPESSIPTVRAPGRFPLAVDRVRFAGEAIAAVAAADRYAAEDALDAVIVEYEPLPVVVDALAALAAGAPVLHEEIGDNVLVRRDFRNGDVEGAFQNADLVLEETYFTGRHAGVPIETRGCVASFERGSGELTLWTSTQVPHLVRTGLALGLGLPENRIRVIAPDIGGGIGIKNPLYPEEIAVAWLARELGRPVRWIEDRREHLQASVHSKDHRYDVAVAARSDGTILGLTARIVCDVGAWAIWPWTAAIEPMMAAGNLPGPYRIAAFEATALGVATNKCPVGPYRGVARPASTFVMERVVDDVARRLGLDPAEVRRRNLLRDEDFPYTSATRLTYDRGSYREALDRALAAIDYERIRERQATSRASGRLLGVGIASFVDLTAPGPLLPASPGMALRTGPDGATVRVDPTGNVTVLAGVTSHGQGLETTLAQVAADALGVALESVTVVLGDTGRTPYGMGSFASRCAVIGGGAVIAASELVRMKLARLAAHQLECSVDDVELRAGRWQARGVPERGLTLRDLAWAAYFGAHRLPEGVTPGLEATEYFDPKRATFANATHVALVEVDPETGEVALLRYVVADDCGRMLNPAIVEGQVRGGVAQGLGGALLEEIVYDRAGQLLTGTFMDYLAPTMLEVPRIEIEHLETLSEVSPHGGKGAGESGAIGAIAAIANAVADALVPFESNVNRVPLAPERVWRIVKARTED